MWSSDGDPQQGGAAFDAELIPHIRANDLYVTQVKFHPRTCGTHGLRRGRGRHGGLGDRHGQGHSQV